MNCAEFNVSLISKILWNGWLYLRLKFILTTNNIWGNYYMFHKSHGIIFLNLLVFLFQGISHKWFRRPSIIVRSDRKNVILWPGGSGYIVRSLTASILRQNSSASKIKHQSVKYGVQVLEIIWIYKTLRLVTMITGAVINICANKENYLRWFNVTCGAKMTLRFMIVVTCCCYTIAFALFDIIVVTYE